MSSMFELVNSKATFAFAATGSFPGVFVQAGITTDKWFDFSDAPASFWLVVGVSVLALVAFIVWASRSNKVPHSIAPGVLGVLVGLLIVWTWVLYLVPALTAAALPATERTWSWKHGETLQDPGGSGLQGDPARGFDIYISQACATCHTLYVRPQDLGTGWAEGIGAEDVARAEDYVHMPQPPLGTQRNGPDLTWIGRRIPDMGYHIDHLVEPRKYKPDSIMPTYKHLSDQDLADLAAFLVTLGNPKQALLAGTVGPSTSDLELSPVAQYGAELYRAEGCVACHSIDGSTNVGPTWLGLWGTDRPLADGSSVFVDAEYIRESIVDPNAKVAAGYPAVMPNYSRLSDEQIEALTAFIESLGGE